MVKKDASTATRNNFQRKIYQTPKVLCFGHVNQLTQAGSTGPSENNSAAGCMDTARKTNPAC